MKRAFFLIILLHYGISNAAEASAPWLTEADIMEVQSLRKTPASMPSAEELTQLEWQAEQYQRSLRNTAARQDGQKHRGAWTAPVPEPAATACAAPVKTLGKKHQSHKRERSISEPSDSVSSMNPPPFEHFTTEVTDASLLVALKALEDMEKNASKLFQEAKQALQEGQQRHKELLATEIDTELPKRTGIKKALNMVQSERKRLESYLDKQTKQHAQLQANSGQALNILIATVLNARTVLKDLQEKVSVKSEKTAVKQEQLRERTNSTSGSPRLSIAKRN